MTPGTDESPPPTPPPFPGEDAAQLQFAADLRREAARLAVERADDPARG